MYSCSKDLFSANKNKKNSDKPKAQLKSKMGTDQNRATTTVITRLRWLQRNANRNISLYLMNVLIGNCKPVFFKSLSCCVYSLLSGPQVPKQQEQQQQQQKGNKSISGLSSFKVSSRIPYRLVSALDQSCLQWMKYSKPTLRFLWLCNSSDLLQDEKSM